MIATADAVSLWLLSSSVFSFYIISSSGRSISSTSFRSFAFG